MLIIIMILSMILTSALIFMIVIMISAFVSVLISVSISFFILILMIVRILISIIILWLIRKWIWLISWLLTSRLLIWVRKIRNELNNENLIWVDTDDNKSDIFNVLEDLNDKISIKSLNISRLMKFSDFVEKNELYFAEKLFDFECRICWMLIAD